MKPITLASMALVATTQFLNALAATQVAAGTAVQSPTALPVLNQLTSHGCYKSQGNLTVMEGVDHVSSGLCGTACTEKKWNVMGLHGSKCYCGMVYPPADAITDDSACNYPCPGYGKEACGSIDSANIFSIFNTGVEVDVGDFVPESSSTSAAPSATSAAATSAVESAVVTKTDNVTPTSNPDKGEKKGPNTAAIAAGVVVGVVIFGAAVGALFFVMRRKRNAEIEEEHRRNAAVNAFINGSKPPSSSGSISMTDSRLDPVMAHRRMSDGSIADNQDYSRRILRVTNA